MQLSLAGIDSTPESWKMDFINKSFSFQSEKTHPIIYRIKSFVVESFTIFLVFLSIYLLTNNLFFIYIGILSVLLYFFSSKYRFKFRSFSAKVLVKKKEIKKIKVSYIKNKNLKIYFKNYYLDCIRYADFVDYLEKVNCYKIYKSHIWIAEFIFKDNPKSGYMLLKYY